MSIKQKLIIQNKYVTKTEKEVIFIIKGNWEAI